MKPLSFKHLSHEILLHTTRAAVADERTKTVVVVALFAEIDARQLYRQAGYPSMYAFVIAEYGMSEDSSFKRIRAAREARKLPAILDCLADGRLHLSAVVLLAPYLTSANAEELLAAAWHKTKAGIERLLAERFPRPDLPSRLTPISSCSQVLTEPQLAPGPVGQALVTLDIGVVPVVSSPGDLLVVPGRDTPVLLDRDARALLAAPPRPGEDRQQDPERVGDDSQPHREEVANEQGLDLRAAAAKHAVAPHAVASVPSAQPGAKVTPLAPERFAVQFTMDQAAHDDLRRIQELLSHRLPSGDIARTFALALQVLRRELEKKKFAATPKPRASRAASGKTRHIPADVKRAVWARDGGSCTFVSDTGRRCGSRKLVEFDHVTEAARGGIPTISGLRLRCRAHNQYGAECTFGPEFMRRKREAARAVTAALA